MPGKGGIIKTINKPKAQQELKVIFVQRLAYSMAELAEAVGLSRSFLYEEKRAGRLVAFKVGMRTIVTLEQAKAWLATWEHAVGGLS